MIESKPAGSPHSAFEDAQALVTGTAFVALGVALYAHAGLLTGGTAGVALLVQYASGWPFGAVFFALNLPFVWLAVRTLGWPFTLKTFAAVALLSVLAEATRHWVRFAQLQPAYAAVIGGFLTGAGLLMLFRHKASLGGVNVLVLYLQQQRGLRAGKVQMAIDCAIVLASFALVPPQKIALSVLGAVALNLVLAINHKPGRYMGV